MVLEKTLERPLDCKEIKPVNPKGNQPWIVIRRAEAEAEAPVLWSPYVKSQLIGKDPDAGKDWGQEEKGETKDEIDEWHNQLNGHEFEQTLGNSEGQGSLACCSPWGHEELGTTKKLNNNNNVGSGDMTACGQRSLEEYYKERVTEGGSPFLKGMLPKSLQE